MNISKTYLEIKKRVRQYLNEILILIGLFFIVFPTYAINLYAGLYLTGAIVIALGLFFAKFPPNKGGYH